ncbi:3-sulfolactaldehyde reductase [Streptomyces sp. RB5]|uniref:3-sulfolactaldehyde reductase n=1 Tax=Streptomyces smaragdinus TaxID=2585196 RepID=A0A7K0CDS8_9ACTN|nr:NAD(P)-binding domain-containing protein [Streptomyces smaragdinus]MQY11600.1 3-sulfolactaldehyde reductase [Streptomyces smaragdinus]
MTADTPPFRVILRMEILPGTEGDFEKTWREVAAGIARQPANLGQTLVRSVEDPRIHFVFTDWADEASFRAFEVSDAHVENRRRLAPFRGAGDMWVTQVVREVPAEPPAPPPVQAHPTDDIAFLGLGNMGGGMAARLIGSGRRLTVHNRTAAKAEPLVAAGATAAASPEEAAAGARVVMLSLADEAAVEDTLFRRVVPVLAPGTVVVDTSTVSPAYAARAAARLAEKGLRRVEACVIGNPLQARRGELRVYAAGEAADVEEVRDVLETIGSEVVHLGGPGTAATIKLLFNLLLGAQVASLAEAVAYGTAAGLDRDGLLTAVAKSGFSSLVMRFRAELMRTRTYVPAFFRSTLMEKDLRLALEAAADARVEMPVLDQVRRAFAAVNAAGDGDRDAAVLIEHIAGATGGNGARS